MPGLLLSLLIKTLNPKPESLRLPPGLVPFIMIGVEGSGFFATALYLESRVFFESARMDTGRSQLLSKTTERRTPKGFKA